MSNPSDTTGEGCGEPELPVDLIEPSLLPLRLLELYTNKETMEHMAHLIRAVVDPDRAISVMGMFTFYMEVEMMPKAMKLMFIRLGCFYFSKLMFTQDEVDTIQDKIMNADLPEDFKSKALGVICDFRSLILNVEQQMKGKSNV